jgi:lysophospholipase L1-like esterase
MNPHRIVLLCAIALLPVAAGPVRAQASSQPAADCAELPALRRRLEQAENRLRDWPALGRYRAADEKESPPAKNEKRVVFMGDSITDNWDNPNFGGFFPDKPYLNRGIGGQTTPQMLLRFRADVIALQPKVVVILAGTNDIAGNTGPATLQSIEDNLESMCELARAHRIRVVLSALLPVSDYEHRQDGTPILQTERRPPEQIRKLNEWIRQYAARNKYPYLDYYAALVDEKGFFKADLSYDGLHPNANGYKVMAPLAEAAIKQALR